MKSWLKRLAIRRARVRLSAAELRATVWKREAVGILRELTLREKIIEKGNERLSKQFQEAVDRLKEVRHSTEQQIRLVEKRLLYAEQLIERHSEVEEGLSSELKILKEIVIPELTLANESIRSQMEADIALQAQRQAAYAPRKSEV